MALSLPETEERPHRGRSSFHVRGRMYATLQPRGKRVVLRLSQDEQSVLGQVQPNVFRHTPWGDQGWTSIELPQVDPWLFEELLVGAWRRLASRRAIARWKADRRRS